MKWTPDVLLVDGNNMFSRAYYAAQASGLSIKTTKTSVEVGAVLKFFQMVKTLHSTYYMSQRGELKYVYVFDGGSHARKKIYPEYKSHRHEPPEDFIPQIEAVIWLLAGIGLPTMRFHGYEADDIIYGLWCELRRTSVETVGIVTRDKDLMQLVDANTRMIDTQLHKEYDTEAVKDKTGVHPECIRMYLAIMGDRSDGVPGVKGYGSVKAQYIASRYPTIAWLFDRLDKNGFADLEEPTYFWDLHRKRDEVRLSYELIGLINPFSLHVCHPRPLKKPAVYTNANDIIHPVLIQLDIEPNTGRSYLSHVGVGFGINKASS